MDLAQARPAAQPTDDMGFAHVELFQRPDSGKAAVSSVVLRTLAGLPARAP